MPHAEERGERLMFDAETFRRTRDAAIFEFQRLFDETRFVALHRLWVVRSQVAEFCAGEPAHDEVGSIF